MDAVSAADQQNRDMKWPAGVADDVLWGERKPAVNQDWQMIQVEK